MAEDGEVRGRRRTMARSLAAAVGFLLVTASQMAAQDPTADSLPFTAEENVDGARFVLLAHRRAGFDYEYVAAADFPTSDQFREIAPESARIGDVAWWTEYVAVFSGRDAAAVLTAEGPAALAVLTDRYGPPRFFRLRKRSGDVRHYGTTGFAFGALVGTLGASYEAYGGLFAGLGMTGVGRWIAPSGLGITIAAAYGGTESADRVNDDKDSRLLFLTLQPTWFTNTATGQVNPYFGLRASWYHNRRERLRWVPDPGFYEIYELDASGFGLGVIFGVQSLLFPAIGIEGFLSYDAVWTGDAREDGQVVPETAKRFGVFSLSGGFTLHFGVR
jgi:hypothetical protein